MTASDMPLALVTGAARGIGRAIAARLLADGYRLLAVDRDAEALRETCAALAQLGVIEAEVADIGSQPDIEVLAEHVCERTDRLDVLVNNAAISIRRPLEELRPEEWQRVLAVNLSGPFLLVRALAPLLRRARGRIVNIASTRAHMSEPHTEAYSASKGGLVALSHALAISLAPEVRVNCISPGWIHTGGPAPSGEDHAFHPAGRVGRPEDVAELVSFLASPRADFITGAEFIIDGGVSRKMLYP